MHVIALSLQWSAIFNKRCWQWCGPRCDTLCCKTPPRHHGAWWYHSCSWANLNGLYHGGPYSTSRVSDGVKWTTFRGMRYSLQRTEMKLKPKPWKKKWHWNNLTVVLFKLRSYSHVIAGLKKQMKKMVKSPTRHGAYVNNPRYNLVIQNVKIFSTSTT